MQKSKGGETTENLIGTLKLEKEELESSLKKEKLQALQLKQELAEAETRNADLYKVIILNGWSLVYARLLCIDLTKLGIFVDRNHPEKSIKYVKKKRRRNLGMQFAKLRFSLASFP